MKISISSKASKNAKIAVFFLTLFFVSVASAQVIFSESFDGTTFPPAGWKRYNFNGAKRWVRDNSVYHTAPGSAMCLRDQRNNDWLVTPRFGPINTADSLIFYYNGGDVTKRDTLLIRVSTDADAADTSKYVTIFTVTANKTTVWPSKTLSLAQFAGQQVYIAFHYASKNVNRIRLDEIKVIRYLNQMLIINASAYGAGTISPVGQIYVPIFSDTTFAIHAVSGALLDSLIVDGINHGTDSIRFKFTNVMANHTITAYFQMKYWTLNTSVVGSGTVTKNPNLTSYAHGTAVELTANPANGWTFVNWGGSASGNMNPYSIIMDTSKNVIAYFVRDTFTIYASASSGGSIAPAGLSYVPKATSLTYTITPSTGYHILDVSVDDSSVGAVGSYTFTNVQTNHTIEAEFELNTYTLFVNTNGNGLVLIQPNQTLYNYGTYVKLTAVPAPGWHFTHWTGNLGGTNNPDSILIDGDKTVTANFAINTYSLIINVNPIGGGTVILNPPGGPYTHNTWVKLQANPITGWHFTGWSDSLFSSNAYDSILMNSDKLVTANFEINYYTLDVTINGNGSVLKTPDTAAYHHGQIVRLDANPGTGWSFRAWGSDLSGSYNPEFILMNDNKNISATFMLDTFTITASTGLHGSVSPAGVTYVGYNSSQTYHIRPDANYHILEILVDSLPVTIESTYAFNNVMQHHTITATFSIDTFAITATAGAGGSITPSGINYVPYGSDQIYEITPNTGYHTIEILVDGNPVAITQTYEFGNVSANHTISATFGIDSFTINASSGPNGSVTPNGSTVVTYGSNQTYNITPNSGYHTLNIIIDGSAVPAAPTYTFYNVTANHTITATFGIDTFKIIASAGTGGTVMPSDTSYVPYGSNLTYYITPNAGYYTSQILVDGTPIAVAPNYTFTGVITNHTINVSFALDSLTIYASASAHGQISPPGDVRVVYNGSQTFTITPDAGSHIVDVLVDNISQGVITGYTFNNVTTNHTIHAVFATDMLSITASAGLGGSVSPSGTISVSYGSNQSFTITPDANYHIYDVLVDGTSYGRIGSYTFYNITTSHTIEAFFQIDSVTITASAGANGQISPSGNVLVPYNSSQTFTIFPNTGYHTIQILVDGIPVAIAPTYTFDNVTSNHTISATFGIDSFTITASAGLGGSVLPDGITYLTYGSNQTYNITPNPGYQTMEIFVDGNPVALAPSYTFTNVISNHTISATFKQDTFTIIATAGPHGTIEPSGITYVPYGGSQTYYITANPGDHIQQILVDGFPVTIAPSYTFNSVQANHTIHATFVADTFTITATSGPNGAVTPLGETYVPNSGSQLYYITPGLGYHTLQILVDGMPVPVAPTYEFVNVRQDHTIHATFGIDSFTITTNAGANGVINPSGITIVTYGSNQTYNIIPNTGYHIYEMRIDSILIPVTQAYTFNNVTNNHTICACFRIDTFAITATTGLNGSIIPSGVSYVNYGDNITYNIVPDANYHIIEVLVDGNPVTSEPTTYAFTNVTQEHTIHATFGIDTFAISASAGENGSITPSGAKYLAYGSSQIYQITPNLGYHTIEILVDGIPVSIAPTYEFTNLAANHTIHAVFGIDSLTIMASADANGSIDPSGMHIVTFGGNKTYSIIPHRGYHIADVIIDGESFGAITYYEFTNVREDHTIHAVFAINTYALNLTIDGNGMVVKNPDQVVFNYGTWVHLSAIPDYNWAFVRWTGDLTGSANPDSIYMDAEKNIDATFADITLSYTLNIDIIGEGSVTQIPDQISYAFGTWVTLSAFPDNEWGFDNWTSNYFSSTNNPDSIIVTGNMTINANFSFDGISGWAQKESVVTALDRKFIRDGGALVAVPGIDENSSALYALLGTKTGRFRKYTISTGWLESDSIHFGYKYSRVNHAIDSTTRYKKYPGRGTALCYNGSNIIYATKGNGTNEFWAYYIDTVFTLSGETLAGWQLKAYVPTQKGLKGGTSIRWFDGKVFLLAGGQRKDPSIDNFWVYDPTDDIPDGSPWTALGKLPLGTNNKAWKDGSSIIEVGGDLYALKGGDKTNSLYRYDWSTEQWILKEPLPLEDTVITKYKRKVLVKDGGATTTDGNVIYAIKGGSADVFWKYTPNAFGPDSGKWERIHPIPLIRKRSVPKTGAALTYLDERVYLLKGNKTPEFWRYYVHVEATDNSIKNTKTNQIITTPQHENTSSSAMLKPIFSVFPNPVQTLSMIQYLVTVNGRVAIKLYNASGRLTETLFDQIMTAGNYTINLHAEKYAKGVYFLKYENGNHSSEVKLIVQ
jgi:hypothetical protein